jgi:hypothetical protein
VSWNSEGSSTDAAAESKHWFRLNFGRLVQPTSIGIQFQAGFAAEKGVVRVQTSTNGKDDDDEWHVVDDDVVWEDVHDIQTLELSCPPCVALQFDWEECTDFYGRLILYQVLVWGNELKAA